mgnify:CR=1 FL=1
MTQFNSLSDSDVRRIFVARRPDPSAALGMTKQKSRDDDVEIGMES